MRKVLLFTLLFSFVVALNAQESSGRDIWCQMLEVGDPMVKDFKKFASMIYANYPDDKKLAQNEIKRKIYFIKIRGLLRRAEEWDKVPVTKRSEYAKQAVKYTTDFLGLIEPGQVSPQPEQSIRTEEVKGDACVMQSLVYGDVEICYADAAYMFSDCTGGTPKKSSIQEFWCVLKFVTILMDCDEAHEIYD